MNLAETVQFGRPWWRDIGNKLVRAVKEATKRGEGAEGTFPPYSKLYAMEKQAGSFPRQSSKSSTPDLTLTGDFLRDLKVTNAREDGATIGWPAQGAKVEWNAASGRPVSTDDQPLAPSILEEFDTAYNVELDRRLTLSAAPVHIRIGGPRG